MSPLSTESPRPDPESGLDAGERLELELGDPCLDRNPLSHARVVQEDETETFPAGSLRLLQQLGFAAPCSPDAWERGDCSLEDLLKTTRAVARRDLTAAVILGQTLLSALPILIGGSDSQRRWLSRQIEHGALGSLALTEEAHGSDLAASDVTVTPSGEGFVLSGRKWLIGNASRGSYLVVLARMASPATASAARFALLLLQRSRLPADRYRCTPKLPTHGVRGADLAGIEFDRCPLPLEARVGSLDGFELIAKTLQVSRVLCAGLCLGAADTALRIALDFAAQRRLYGGTVLDLGAPAHQLGAAFADLLAAEAVALLGHRAIGEAPEMLPLVSPIVKAGVPCMAERVVAACARVLGARHYLRAAHRAGIFQKLLRDSAVVSLFDGNTSVNLSLLAAQLPALARDHLRPRLGASPAQSGLVRVRELLRIDSTRPARLPGSHSLRLGGVERDPILACLPACIREVDSFERPGRTGALDALRRAATEWHDISGEVLRLRRAGAFVPSSLAAHRLAERYIAVHAAAACGLLWIANAERSDPFFAAGIWVEACIDRLLGANSAPATLDALIARALQLERADRTLSLWPARIAERGRASPHAGAA